MAREFPFGTNASRSARKRLWSTTAMRPADMTRGFRKATGGGGGGSSGGGGSGDLAFVDVPVFGTTYTLYGESISVLMTADGQALVSSPSPIQLTRAQPDPHPHAVTGARVGTAMINPRPAGNYALHGNYPSNNIAFEAVLPVAFADGDSALHTIPEETLDMSNKDLRRKGLFLEENTITRLPHPLPTINFIAFAPPIARAIGNAPTVYDFDLLSFAQALPRLPFSVITPSKRANLADITTRNKRFQPVPAITPGTTAGAGYETAYTFQQYKPGNSSNYAPDRIGLKEWVQVFLMSDLPTDAEKVELLIGSVSNGLQLLLPFEQGGRTMGANGAHGQAFQDDVALANHFLGNPHNHWWSVLPGNFQQAFRWTQTMIDNDLVPHTSATKPWMWFETTVGSISPDGLTVGFDLEAPAMPFRTRWDTKVLVRKLGGEALMTGPTALNTGYTDAPQLVTLATPIAGLAVNDVIYTKNGPAFPIVAGQYDWAVGAGGGFWPENYPTFDARATRDYGQLQHWSVALHFLKAAGLWFTELDIPWGFMEAVLNGERGFTPTDMYSGGGGPKEFIDAHRAAISMM